MKLNWAPLALILISNTVLAANPAPGGQSNPMSQFIILGFFLLFLYFMIIRPQSKRAKEHKALIEGIAVGDEVVTAGGLIAKVTKLGDQFLTVAIAEGIEVHVQKGMVVSSLPKGTIKAL
jgi:preprotein translocase subunit YajC